MNILEPCADDISTFFDCLSLDLDGLGYYEVRLLYPDPNPSDPTTRTRSRRFPTTLAGLNAATDYAAEWNRKGFNAYATPNPLLSDQPRDGHRAAIDEDAACGAVHLLDADSTDPSNLAAELTACGFSPAFWVTTGTVPSLRLHIYFRLDDWVFDMMAWTMMQRRLAVHFGTDPAVCNPSRVMRIAGSVAYPSAAKRERGYLTELTSLTVGLPVTGSVPVKAFYDAFPAPPRWVQPVGACPAPDAGAIPCAVIAAALDAIPPVSCHGERNRWLQVAYACKEVGDSARLPFEAWQRRSPRWATSDAWVWNTLRNPTPGSYRALFRLAKNANPDWWRTSAETKNWMIETTRQRSREDTSALDRWKNRIKHGLRNHTRRGQ